MPLLYSLNTLNIEKKEKSIGAKRELSLPQTSRVSLITRDLCHIRFWYGADMYNRQSPL